MRVLVTGGAGFIGSHVVEGLLAQGAHVYVVDDLSAGRREMVPSGAHFIEGDILTPDDWTYHVGSVEAVVHLAAEISVPKSELDPLSDVKTNVLGTVAVLEAALKLSAREVRMASSAAVYGNATALPLAETEGGQILSVYGMDKWIDEQYLAFYASRRSLKTVALRLANVYGPRQRTEGEGGVVAIFAETLAQGGTPQIFGDGQQTRDFIYVGDVARAFSHRLGEKGQGGLYNVATTEETTILALWRRMAGIAGVSVDAVSFGPKRAGDISHSVLDNARARAWGFEPRTTLEDGLSQTYAYFQAKHTL